MQWNKSQKALINLATEPIDGFALEIVELQNDDAELVKVIREICGAKKYLDSRHVRICASSEWDVLGALIEHTNGKRGGGYFAGYTDALKALAYRNQSVTLWLEEIRLMRVQDRERMTFRLENIAWHLGINLRIVMLNGKSRVWVNRDEKTGEWVGARRSKYLYGEKLNAFARQWKYDGKRIEERDDILPLFSASEHEKVQEQAVKIA